MTSPDAFCGALTVMTKSLRKAAENICFNFYLKVQCFYLASFKKYSHQKLFIECNRISLILIVRKRRKFQRRKQSSAQVSLVNTLASLSKLIFFLVDSFLFCSRYISICHCQRPNKPHFQPRLNKVIHSFIHLLIRINLLNPREGQNTNN